MKVTGTIQEIVARETRAGVFYDVKVDGKKYGHGKYPPRGVKEGDVVTFEVDVKQNGQYTNYDIRRGSLRPDDGTAAPEPSKATWADRNTSGGTSAPASGRGAYVAFDERQEIISKQAALNTALSKCKLAVELGAFSFPKSVKESDKLSLVHQWVLEEATQVYNLTTGRDWSMPETEAVAKPKAPGRAVKAPEPETDEAADSGYDEYPE